MNKKKFDLNVFLGTGLYSGFSPVAPGTAGTLVGMVIYMGLYLLFGQSVRYINAILVLIMIIPSIKIGDACESYFNKKDPQEVVLDEMMGYWISVFMFPFSWPAAIGAFFIFRIMDIIKPYPADKLQNLSGGLGIMIDDYIAGIYTAVILLVSSYIGLPVFT